MANLFAKKPLSLLCAEAAETGEHSLKRTLGVFQLTSLGVGAVIAMVGIGNGARADIEAKVASLGENVIPVWSGSRVRNVRPHTRTSSGYSMKYCTFLLSGSPGMNGGAPAARGDLIALTASRRL